MLETLQSATVESSVGPLFLAVSVRGLVALEFDQRLPGQQTIRPNPRDLRVEPNGIGFREYEGVQAFVRKLHDYFQGKRRDFSFPLDLRGTEFQVACWRALLAIPTAKPEPMPISLA